MGIVNDRAGMSVSTTGTGTITLNAALGAVAPNLATFQSFATAGVQNGQLLPYLILDANNNWEIGIGTYSSSGPTLTRGSLWSSNGGAAINMTASAQVFITSIAEDLNVSMWGGYRSKFRNGHMDVAQRGQSGSVLTATTSYTLDGWQITTSGAAASWSQQYNQNISGNALRISCASGLTACTLRQRIESYVAAELLAANKSATPPQITIQFTIFNSTGSTITPSLATGYASAPDNFATVVSDLGQTAVQSIANGAFGTVAYTYSPNASLTNGYEIQLVFGGALNNATGYVDISLADVSITPAVATGVNNNPPPPEERPVGSELSLCQRYFQKSYSQTVALGTNVGSGNGGASSSFSNAVQTYLGAFLRFATVMRVAPTVTTYDNAGNSGKISWNNGSVWTNNAAYNNIITNDNGFTLNGGPFTSVVWINFDFAATAEL